MSYWVLQVQLQSLYLEELWTSLMVAPASKIMARMLGRLSEVLYLFNQCRTIL